MSSLLHLMKRFHGRLTHGNIIPALKVLMCKSKPSLRLRSHTLCWEFIQKFQDECSHMVFTYWISGIIMNWFYLYLFLQLFPFLRIHSAACWFGSTGYVIILLRLHIPWEWFLVTKVCSWNFKTPHIYPPHKKFHIP